MVARLLIIVGLVVGLLYVFSGPKARARALKNLKWVVGAAVAAALLFVAIRAGLHWLAVLAGLAVAAASRLAPLLRYVPLARRGFEHYQRRSQQTHDQETAGSGAERASGTMSREEALRVLGLQQDASREQIVASYRNLIRKVHPDQGGSTYLAQQLNQAKDVLLG